MVKQVSHIAVIILDQNGRAKRKVSRPRNRREEVLKLEQGSYAVKRGLLGFEMNAKQPPH